MDRVGASVARAFVVNGSRGGLVANAIQPRSSYAVARICLINRCIEYLSITSHFIDPVRLDALKTAPDSLAGRYLKLSRRAMFTSLAVIGIMPLKNHGSYAQMATQDKPPIAYFLDRVPDNLDISTLPKTAREVVVARVRIAGRPAYLVGRDQSGMPPPLPPYLFYAELKILDVHSGNAAVGSMVDVTFAVPNSSGLIHHPHTPSQLDRDYNVVMYSGDDDKRHLAGFPISETQYREWEAEVWSYERSRSVPPKSR